MINVRWTIYHDKANAYCIKTFIARINISLAQQQVYKWYKHQITGDMNVLMQYAAWYDCYWLILSWYIANVFEIKATSSFTHQFHHTYLCQCAENKTILVFFTMNMLIIKSTSCSTRVNTWIFHFIKFVGEFVLTTNH